MYLTSVFAHTHTYRERERQTQRTCVRGLQVTSTSTHLAPVPSTAGLEPDCCKVFLFFFVLSLRTGSPRAPPAPAREPEGSRR